MQDFSGKIAVVTGGGSGIGRALVLQLVAEGCSIAMCDIGDEDMAETTALAEAQATQGAKIISFHADVGNEDDIIAFRDYVLAETGEDHIHLLFNNAGIGGGGSFVAGDRGQWERTFNVCWDGVYLTARAFMPLLVKANEAHIVNVSSVNGFWASIGPDTPHTAYCAAKFAVKGFTEALLTDLAINAPHVKASVVMPGHIGTSIAINSVREHGVTDILGPGESEEEVRQRMVDFRDNGMEPAEAAKIILDGVREEEWRILVGDDAKMLDAATRTDPKYVLTREFVENAVPTMET
ncbi:SDR family oxidoreductase [Parasphingopyxis sp.]|uniref:SDR family NAD(P)-dependent oxidoreductase n=1 Tax=Parasphingopyxis sp. TaxID=1920299 RepID=UPI0026395A58|nr:SDR family oxidoreductase [Parasphingopyxis sp.]